ncbi:MAG: hypothetical protein JNJ71_19705 [Rubrivivax sp.]|nr:hypothetical protein [Rubrivivax sp.]
MSSDRWVIPSRKPRNPLVAASRSRHAGAHRDRRREARGGTARQLRAELRSLHSPPHET